MAIEMTYRCDRCGLEVEPEEIFVISVHLTAVRGRQYTKYSQEGESSEQGKQHWCLKCLVKTGAHKPLAAVGVKPEPQTLHDMVTDMIRLELNIGA